MQFREASSVALSPVGRSLPDSPRSGRYGLESASFPYALAMEGRPVVRVGYPRFRFFGLGALAPEAEARLSGIGSLH